MVLIKPKIGDVLEPDGLILTDRGPLRAGLVIIHRSRLRRAKRFGWVESPYNPPSHQVAPKLVAVARA